MPEFVDAFIISWPGKHEDAASIAERLEGSVDRLTIFYANAGDVEDGRAEPWRRFPNSWYFGRQFKAMIDRCDGDVLLHVMADARCDDWPGLVAGLRKARESMPQIGIWSPNVDYSSHPFDEIDVGPVANSSLHVVTRTDETVWALSRDVVMHMRTFDYDLTPLGWGIDIAAAFYCHAQQKPVVLDTALPVFHPRSTGYSPADADIQMVQFLRQMSAREAFYRVLISRPFRHTPLLRRWLFWATRTRRYKAAVAGR